MSNEKGATIPPRQRPTPPGQSPQSEAERQEAEAKIIQSAPLRSTDAESTNAPAEQQPEPAADVKPWRAGMGLPVEALMQIRKKTSITQATEHELRLAFLVNDRNSKRGFGPKVYVNDLINEAIEQYTKGELKKLGYDTK